MSSNNGRRHARGYSLLDKFEAMLQRAERCTESLARIATHVVVVTAQAVTITRHAVWIAVMIVGVLTCSGSLHQVVAFLG